MTDKPEWVADCAWCSGPIYSDEEYTEGDDGEGWMHVICTNYGGSNDLE